MELHCCQTSGNLELVFSVRAGAHGLRAARAEDRVETLPRCIRGEREARFRNLWLLTVENGKLVRQGGSALAAIATP